MNRRTLVAGIVAAPFVPALARAAPSPGLGPLALASAWIGERTSLATLRGRIVLVDVFTFECINCRNVTPALEALYAAYPRSAFEIVAVHTPEVPRYQRSLAYLAREAHAAALRWPIAVDNDHRIWDAYGVSAWPTQLLFDRAGHLHATFVGDGDDARVAAAVHALIRA